MTVKYDSSSHFGWWFVIEPIVNKNRELFAVEVLTRFATPGGPLLHISKMPITLKKELLIAQLIQIVNKRIFFEENNILCSVNIDTDMATILIKDPEVSGIISTCHFIRLEIYESFDGIADGFRNPLLKALHGMHPLWLDDFGSGSSCMISLQSGLYERVKIDKAYFWEYYHHPEMKTLVKKLGAVTQGVIIEGVERDDHLEIFSDKKVLYQGYLFKQVQLDCIENLLNAEEDKSSQLMLHDFRPPDQYLISPQDPIE